ncbi:MAG: ABC transmembrane type-1 domain-containing protein [Burkholderia sp.]|jgi:molybdate transport system permease protein
MLEVLSEPDVLFSLRLTAVSCLTALGLFVVFAPALGYALARHPGTVSKTVGFIVTIPIVFPPIALGYILLTILGRSGPLGAALSAAGMPLVFTKGAVILAGFIAGLPLVVRPLQAAFGSTRLRELEEAARVLGASNLSVFFRITLPLVRPSLAVGLLMGCARVSGEVGITMMLGGNIAGKTNTLSLEIFNAVSRGDFEVADTLCLVLSLFAALLFLAMEAVLRKSVKL